MSIEDKIDKILDKLEKTSVDVAVLCEVVKENKNDIIKNEKEINLLKQEVNEMKTEVEKLKGHINLAKYVAGLVISGMGAIIFNIFDMFK